MSGYGPYLKQAIERQDISYADLAKRLGKGSKTAVQNMADGKREPRAYEINILARELPISVEELLSKMGINLYTDEASHIPTRLRLKIAHMTPEQLAVVESLIDSLMARDEGK